MLFPAGVLHNLHKDLPYKDACHLLPGGRGGARPGAGRKKTAVKDKAENGNPGGRKLEVLDIPAVEGVAMPKPHDFLSAEQRDGSVLQAQEIYTETWQWLKGIGCAAKVSPQLLERYAMCSARWVQCEEMTIVCTGSVYGEVGHAVVSCDSAEGVGVCITRQGGVGKDVYKRQMLCHRRSTLTRGEM